MRYAWTDLNIDGTHARKNPVIDGFMRAFRKWDKKAASRVHQFAAISQTVSRRIADAYQREAPVFYPPVEVERFHPREQRENFYITITRLVPHKRVDVIVQAFSTLNLSLVVVGDGAELPHLQKLAGKMFASWVTSQMKRLLNYLAKHAASSARQRRILASPSSKHRRQGALLSPMGRAAHWKRSLTEQLAYSSMNNPYPV